jgi:DNA repair protein RecN (Recombination protein N)
VALLVELSISNLAIIDHLRLQFSAGFNVLTGETGTGKSIIIDAVSLLLGARASTDLVRTGADGAAVEGVFQLDAETLRALQDEFGALGLLDDAELAAGELIVRREVSAGGRSSARVNGRAVTQSVLRDLGRHLIDIHGQGDQLTLLQARRHIDFLDRYGGLEEPRAEVAGVVRRLREVREALRALQRDARELARRVDLLTFQVDEIRAARLHPDEEADLRRERTLLANAEKLKLLADSVYELLFEGEERQRSVVDQLGAVVDHMAALQKVDDTLGEQSQTVETALYQLEELARTMRAYRDEVAYDPQRLEQVEERIDLIANLKRKYGDTIAEVLAFADRAQEELDGISHSEERQEELRQTEVELLGELGALAENLSVARRAAAEALTARVESELKQLGMEHARFIVATDRAEAADGLELGGRRIAFDATGIDRIEFLIAPNPGEDPKPLASTASGGEASRLMLALKTALSEADPVPTLIFDEIDAGIGGRTGRIVGRKLWDLSREHQVFCVTHLAQMASYGETHLRVEKDVVGGRTLSKVQALSPEERVNELALMLGGAATESTRRSARELLAESNPTQMKEPQLT